MAEICGLLLVQGFCLNDTCEFRHNTSFFCLTCNIPLNSQAAYNGHIQSGNHLQAINGSEWLKCQPCNRHYRQGSLEQTSHKNSDRHVRFVAHHPVDAGPPVVDIPFPPDWTRCDACKKTFPSSLSLIHDQSDRHLSRLRIFNYQTFLSRSEANQRGIEVQGPQNGIDLGTHAPNLGITAPTMVLLTCSGQTHVSFLRARVSSSLGVQNPAGGQN
ncbi:hypothetical protein B0J17DRAFT_680484 [Rhizoctonia solani]|nr:hypothetical protein B0J17DRAFT_680484 [Rhizoctonia solani]